MEKIKRFFKEEEGLELSEYAIMGALIILIAAGTVTLLGNNINDVFSAIKDKIVVPA